ncbi:MAG: helix-turn-helix domain-containing protein [Flavobacteriales bacterium]|nr:helix-turn-helix domain-containing protein [Flavobacteriales bacterium]
MKEKQEVTILNHLLKGGAITNWQAITEYGITRLARYISTLIQKGYDIDSKWDKNEATGARFKTYWLMHPYTPL